MAGISQMPPLILHPFSGGRENDPLDGVRADLALRGIASSDDEDTALYRRMIAGRYQEVRMLIFLGKDIFRWLGQCVEHVNADEKDGSRVVEQSFAALLVEEPPDSVRRKLDLWGVTDRRAVFSRAIGIYSLFSEPPPVDSLSSIFLRNYHRFADHAYICFQHLKPFTPLGARRFQFEIYASEEYARLLSDQWDSSPG
jgi:hypothetical protein